MEMRGWCITWGEHTWTDDTVPAAFLDVVSDIAGDSWQIVSPWNGPAALMAWLRALLASVSPGDSEQDKLDAATIAVWTAPLGAVLAALGDRPSPVARADGSSASSSEPSPRAGADASGEPSADAADVSLDVSPGPAGGVSVPPAGDVWVQVTRDPG